MCVGINLFFQIAILVDDDTSTLFDIPEVYGALLLFAVGLNVHCRKVLLLMIYCLFGGHLGHLFSGDRVPQAFRQFNVRPAEDRLDDQHVVGEVGL